MSGPSDVPRGDTGVPPQPSGAERDLSFLWPVIDRIRAVEIKFTADSVESAASGAVTPKPGIEVRLKALEDDIAAIKQALHNAPRDAADAAPAGPAIELSAHRWHRVAAAAIATVLMLLVAHWLIVFVYDKPTIVLRLVSIAIPLPAAVWLTLRHHIVPWWEILYGLALGAIAVFGMAYVTSVHEHTSWLPENMREWQETLEYTASIMFAHLTGVLISSAIQARSGAQNRAGAATLRLAQMIAFVTGRAISGTPKIKEHVDSIHGLVTSLMPVASAIMAIVTGIRGFLG